MNTKSGSPAQKFLARHKEFLRHWADGLHALEIAQRMGLSPAQLAKHSLKAFEEKAPRKIPGYDCIFWDDLPKKMRDALPNGKPGVLVKYKSCESGIILEALSRDSTSLEITTA